MKRNYEREWLRVYAAGVLIGLVLFAVGAGAACYVKNENTNVNQPSQVFEQPPTPAPSASPSASPSPGGGDNTVTSFAIFCYGFGAAPGQPEPNHQACTLPPGYPEIAITASPKNRDGTDVPFPGTAITWQATLTPAGCGVFEVDTEVPFNVTLTPAPPRVDCAAGLVATYTDPGGKAWTASKVAKIQK